MSAFQVSEQHIGAMVRFWLNSDKSGYARFRGVQANHADAADIMAVLAQTCFDSVRYRYSSGPLPGPVSAGEAPVQCVAPLSTYRKLTPVEAIKACHCYAYQSCEHPGWQTSEGKRICDDIVNAATHALAGYQDAPWCIDETEADRLAAEAVKRSAFHAQAVR